MAEILQFCNQIFPLDKAASADLLKNLKTKTFQKGDYLLRSGEICKYLFFMNEGLAKSFFVKNDNEFIMSFFAENFMFSVYDSYISQTPSNFSIIALEKTTVTLISHEKMEKLCRTHHCVETFFRKLVSNVTIKMMKRISSMLQENAADRYNLFVRESNEMLQRISLGDLAKYFGITQQSLSRIRAEKWFFTIW